MRNAKDDLTTTLQVRLHPTPEQSHWLMTKKGFSPPQAAVVSTQAVRRSLALAKWSLLWEYKTMKQTLEEQRDEHHVHLIVYHLIWCPRRPV
jgi:hypothetical protein